jgi:ParB family transcriptional regulator, chromosome partitioning protein
MQKRATSMAKAAPGVRTERSAAPACDWVEPESLDVREPFSTLFPIKCSVQDAVDKSMRTQGYDASKPIVVWRQKNLIVDGHTRQISAIKAGVKALAFYHDFADEDQALEYAIANQRDRRNLTDADILKCVELLDRRSGHGGDRGNQHTGGKVPMGILPNTKSSERTAEIIGTSSRTVSRARRVLDQGTSEIKKAVGDGKMTIRMAERQTQTARPRRTRRSPVDLGPAKPASNGSAYQTWMPQAVEITEEEATWVAALPLANKVPGSRFKEDAVLYRRIQSNLGAIRSLTELMLGPGLPAWAGRFHRLVAAVTRVQNPEHWLLCSKCQGKGQSAGTCSKCQGSGYQLS